MHRRLMGWLLLMALAVPPLPALSVAASPADCDHGVAQSMADDPCAVMDCCDTPGCGTHDNCGCHHPNHHGGALTLFLPGDGAPLTATLSSAPSSQVHSRTTTPPFRPPRAAA